MESEKEMGRDRDAKLKVKINGINNVKRQVVYFPLFFFVPWSLSSSSLSEACLSPWTDEIANDL